MASKEESYRAESGQHKKRLFRKDSIDRKREGKRRAVTDSGDSDSDKDFKTNPPQPKSKLILPKKKVRVEKEPTQTQLNKPKKIQSQNMFSSQKSNTSSHSSSYSDRHSVNRSAKDSKPRSLLSTSTSSYKPGDRDGYSKSQRSDEDPDFDYSGVSELIRRGEDPDFDYSDVDELIRRDEEYLRQEKSQVPRPNQLKESKSSEDNSDCQVDNQRSKLFLPSRKKREPRAGESERNKIIEKLEKTHQIEKATVFTCPFCLVGFDKTTKVIEKELDLIAKKDREYKQRYIKEHEHSSFRKPDELIKREVSTKEKEAFCRMHERELVIKPKGITKGYLFDIDFKELGERIKRMQLELDDVIFKRIPSDYRNVILEDYDNLGTNKARTPMMMMNRMDSLLPGYYGPRGAAVMLDVLSDMYLKSGKLTKQLSAPQMPMEYLHQVLIPETAYRLIRQDIFRKHQRDNPKGMLTNANIKAKTIMHESRHFGEAMYPLTDDREDEETKSTSREIPKGRSHVTIVLD